MFNDNAIQFLLYTLYSSFEKFTKNVFLFVFLLTLVSPSGASGSVIHDPYLEPDVLIVTGSLIPVSFPHAVNNE